VNIYVLYATDFLVELGLSGILYVNKGEACIKAQEKKEK
jgi:hypothetical protein